MYCKACGRYIDGDSVYCKYCGKKQSNPHSSIDPLNNLETTISPEVKFPQYDYPKRLFDFDNNQEIEFEGYRELEKYIQSRLKSNDTEQIKDGLSNVLGILQNWIQR